MNCMHAEMAMCQDPMLLRALCLADQVKQARRMRLMRRNLLWCMVLPQVLAISGISRW